MNTLRDDLNEAMRSEKIEGIEFLRMNDWQWVLEKLANEFLSEGKKSLDRIWLWDSIKEPYSTNQLENTLVELKSILNDFEYYWFIASDEDGKYWVLDGTGKAIITLLSEMRCFEYYIVDKKFSWLICENHHDVMVFKGAIEFVQK